MFTTPLWDWDTAWRYHLAMLRIEPCLKLAGWAATDPEWMGLLLRMKIDPHFFPKKVHCCSGCSGKHCILL